MLILILYHNFAKKQNCKKNVVKLGRPNGFKLILAILTKLVAIYI